MHQTFYIDIDEEITSIVERLRKAKASEIIIVVPKRALLIQSIVNLRLLKKEAEALSLQLMIVTQDKLGKLLVEKAGILVQQKLDESLGEEIEDKSEEKHSQILPAAHVTEEETVMNNISNKERLNSLGSDSYFESYQENIQEKRKKIMPQKEEEKKGETLLNKELVTGISMDVRAKAAPSGIRPVSSNQEAGRNSFAMDLSKDKTSDKNPYAGINKIVLPGVSNEPQDKKIEQFFYHSYPNGENHDSKAREQENSVSGFSKGSSPGSYKMVIWAVIIVLFLALGGAAAYLFIPKAIITLSVKEKTKAQDCEITGNVNVSSIEYDSDTIPAKLVSVTAEVSQKFDSTGSSASSNQKAKGTVTIYNEFGTASQPLVATTRLLSEDGKLFRLVKGVTVPGYTKDGDTIKPGTVEAEVIADEAGEQYNIEAAKFSIPGFKDSGSDKYTKIYAKSSKSMAGGGSGGSASQIKTVSETDIANAKTKIQVALRGKLEQSIKESSGGGMMVMDEAISSEEPTYKLSSSAGEVADSFEITAQVKASAIVFQEDDLKSVVNSIIAKSGGGKMKMDGSSLVLEYGKLDADFKTGVLNIKVHGVGKITSDLNLDTFKKNILGKTNEEFENFLDNYSDIEKAEITYWPPFISGNIPKYEKRVDIVVNKVMDTQ